MLSSGTATSGGLEFRPRGDEAWYDVELQLEGEGDVLRVKYCKFSEESDELFAADGFRSFLELEDFEARFRPLSVQLQDSECRSVSPGMAVCASFSSRCDDLRFYDALVDEHGPNSGNLTVANIASMCRIQSGVLKNTVLAIFFKKVRDKIQVKLSKDDLSLIHYDARQMNNCSPNFKHQPPISQLMSQEKCCAMLNEPVPIEDQRALRPRYSEIVEQDTDIGGMKYQCMILIENIDKELSPFRLAKFLHAQTAILPRVYIFPSLPSDSYARGAIVLNCKKNLESLYDFLNNPDHVIASSRGRPLVVTGKVESCDTFGGLAGGAMVLSSDNELWKQSAAGVCNELRVHSPGTKEYIAAKQMKELFVEFISHQRRLHQRLAMEEGKIRLQRPFVS